VPLTLAILVFAVPLVRIVFERGRFDAASTQITSQAVFFYALGLLAYAGVRFFSHAFYAMQDTLTPVKTAAVALLLNVVLNSFFVFVLHLRVAGLALASSISAAVNFLLLYARLKKAVGLRLDLEFRLFLFRTTLAACGMIVALLIVFNRVFFGQASWALMAALAASGAGIYSLLLWVLDVKEARALWSWLRARK
jgi:putative peptidoglycan lipid II flippase